MKIIGLTGGIASGKSTVSKLLRAMGAIIIDVDEVAREIVKKDTPALQDIVAYFSEDILLENGELNRKKLGGIVFSNPSKLKMLNDITHPRIFEEIQREINKYKQNSKNNVIIIDAALLIETDLKDMVDEIWLVAIPEEIQIKRLMERDYLTLKEAKGRLASQMSTEEKLPYVQEIIDNSGEIEDLKKQVKNLWGMIN